jgi:Fe-S oxidoreductase
MTLLGAYEPAGLMYIARGLALGALQWDKDLADFLYSCTLCGYCEDLCSRGYRHTPSVTILEELRRIIPDELKPQSLTRLAQYLCRTEGNQLSLLKAYGITDPDEESRTDTILFADRTIIANPGKLHEIGFILEKSGRRIGCFMNKPLPPVDTALLNAGFAGQLEECIEEIDARIETRGIKQVICYNPESLSVLLRHSNSRAEFMPVTRLYSQMVAKKPHKKLKMAAVTYQDPCHLGRYAKEYLAPRQVIAGLGLVLKEMWRTRHNSLCCGSGGGVLFNKPALAKQYAANRWEEAKATGARVMITACPFCTINLNSSKPKGLSVVDLTSLMAEAFGYKRKAVAR